MIEDSVVKFLDAYPEYTKTLRHAIFQEDIHDANQYYSGWQWSDVKTTGAKLQRLVVNDIAEIYHQGSKRAHYRLANKEVTRKGLEAFEKKQSTLAFAPTPPLDIEKMLREVRTKIGKKG